jgi:hypothetical protein
MHRASFLFKVINTIMIVIRHAAYEKCAHSLFFIVMKKKKKKCKKAKIFTIKIFNSIENCIIKIVPLPVSPKEG